MKTQIHNNFTNFFQCGSESIDSVMDKLSQVWKTLSSEKEIDVPSVAWLESKFSWGKVEGLAQLVFWISEPIQTSKSPIMSPSSVRDLFPAPGRNILGGDFSDHIEEFQARSGDTNVLLVSLMGGQKRLRPVVFHSDQDLGDLKGSLEAVQQSLKEWPGPGVSRWPGGK